MTVFLSWLFGLSAFGACPSSEGDILRNYEGTIGDHYRVRLTIVASGERVEGVYFYATRLKDIKVQGKILNGTKLLLNEFDARGKVTARFEGEFAEQDPLGKFGSTKLQCEVIVGSWIGQNNLSFYFAQESESGGTLANRYSIAGAKDDELIHRKAKSFWEAVKRGDKKAVARQIAYPIKVTIEGEAKRIRNAKELVDHYKAIFSSDYVQAISKALPRNMFARDQGIMLGRGEVWFGPDGKVIALNNF